jgi:glycosyltransferase involved in cell wall biosynthesis
MTKPERADERLDSGFAPDGRASSDLNVGECAWNIEPKPSAHVTIVTEAGDGLTDSLYRTAQSLLAQSFEDWSWTIVTNGDVVAPVDDPRIRTLRLSSRPESLSEATAGAQFVALLDEGVELREHALEKWLWFLASHDERPGVTGVGLADRARLYRKEAIDAAGGCDAAWATAHPLGSVPWTGAGRDPKVLNEPDGDERSRRPRSWVDQTVPFRIVRPKTTRRLMLITPFMALGGADRVNIEILRGLSERGWDLTVATLRAEDHRLYPTYEAITTDLFPLAEITAPADAPRLLDYLMDSRRPDVVLMSQTELGYRLLPFLRSREFKPAFVDLCHSEDAAWYGGGFPRFSVEYGALLDRTVVVSSHLREWMIRRGAAPERIVVCHANVDHEMFVPDAMARERVRAKLGISAHHSTVLWVGRLSEEKRPTLLPLISAALTTLGFEHTMLVVGDGPERQTTEDRAVKEADSRLVFLGEIDHAALPSVYAASDVVLLPSRIEGIALTLFEAMSSGVPVVAANIGGQAELVTSDVGLLVESRDDATDVAQYAAALAAVLGDPERRAAMASACRARIEAQFTTASMLDRFEQALEEALEQHATTPVSVPDPVLARVVAAESVELMRLVERRSAGQHRSPTDRERLYTAAQRLGGPAYRWASARHVPGLRSARNLAHRAIVGH